LCIDGAHSASRFATNLFNVTRPISLKPVRIVAARLASIDSQTCLATDADAST
jgi:hypothetical protein